MAQSFAPIVVEESCQGMRLQDFLESTWPDADRVFLRRLWQEGLITVNRMGANGRTKLGPGDVVQLTLPEGVAKLPPRRVAAAERELKVLAECSTCLVVDKVAGMPTVPDRAGKDAGVHGRLQALRPDADLRVAHRLDRDTSGCLVLAVGLDGARWLDEQLRERLVDKRYLALVEGVVARDAFDIRRALGPDTRRPGKVRVVADGAKKSREAWTAVRVLERFQRHTLVEAAPKTGRSHQIRVHLQSLGHPIVADTDYGASGPLLLSAIKRGYKARSGTAEKPLLSRMFLHAARVTVPLPEAEPLTAEAPLPPDLQTALDKMRRFAASRRQDPCS